MNLRKVSGKQESRVESKFKSIDNNTRKTISSGSLWFDKADINTDKYRIECKTKVKKSKQITIKKEWLDKVEAEGFEDGKIGIVVFSFGDGKDYVVISLDDFIESEDKHE